MGKVYVNRTLNLKKIKYLGLDMDHTLVRYKTECFEQSAFKSVLKKLVENKKYPKEILNIPFQFKQAIRGLVIDKKNGNILKLNRYSGIRLSYHGTKPIDFKIQKDMYKSIYIDLSDSNYYPVDTTFSISPVLLFAQLVDLKDSKLQDSLPVYVKICDDIMECLDKAHRDGTLKDEVKNNLDKFLIPDPECVAGLENFKRSGKKIFILTNSFFDYTRLLLDYTINPYLKDHSHWSELFEFVITGASKPKFFYEPNEFLKIDIDTGKMRNTDELIPGVYQGGYAIKFSEYLKISGEEILYIGDHIYGDILRLKKDCNWRTGLVVEELLDEVKAFERAKPFNKKINDLMAKKEPLEKELIEIAENNIKNEQTKKEYDGTQTEITRIDSQISELIASHQKLFNPLWGEVMRIGNEESYFASQVERYACIYMAFLSDLLHYSPRTYFRGFRRTLPHEA